MVARFTTCPSCGKHALVGVVRRDWIGDLVVFLRCIRCGYTDKQLIADSYELGEEAEEDED